jgi:hypothetical protein
MVSICCVVLASICGSFAVRQSRVGGDRIARSPSRNAIDGSAGRASAVLPKTFASANGYLGQTRPCS